MDEQNGGADGGLYILAFDVEILFEFAWQWRCCPECRYIAWWNSRMELKVIRAIRISAEIAESGAAKSIRPRYLAAISDPT